MGDDTGQRALPGQLVTSAEWSPYQPFQVSMMTQDGVYDRTMRHYLAHGHYRVIPVGAETIDHG